MAHAGFYFWLVIVSLLWTLRWTLPLIVGPFVIHRKHFMLVDPPRVRADLDSLSPETAGFVRRIGQELEAEGFAPDVVWSLGEIGSAVNAATAVQAIFCHPARGEVAGAIVSRAKSRRTCIFYVATHFADGRRLSTGNRADAGVFPRDPSVDSCSFSWIKDAATLLEAHRRRLERAGAAGREKSAIAPGGEMDLAQSSWQRECRHLVACGYQALSKSQDRYRPTWKGAALMAWRAVPWIKRIRTRRREREMRAIWDELGMAQWQPAQAPVERRPIRVLPTSQAQRSEVEPALAYQAALGAGSLRREWNGETLIVRSGGTSLGDLVLRCWVDIALGLFCLALFMCGVFWMWAIWRLGPSLGPMRSRLITWRSVTIYGILLLSPVAFFYRFWKEIKREVGGGSIVSASYGGLTFTNAPGVQRTGSIAREDLHGLHIAPHRVTLLTRGRRYRLEAILNRSERRIGLLIAANKRSVEEARDALLVAMGINSAAAESVEVDSEVRTGNERIS